MIARQKDESARRLGAFEQGGQRLDVVDRPTLALLTVCSERGIDGIDHHRNDASPIVVDERQRFGARDATLGVSLALQ
jgi:hypothetical protein